MAFQVHADAAGDSMSEQVWTLCYYASRGDVHRVTDYMHQEGLRQTLKESLLSSALMLATKQGQVRALRTLAAAGADVNRPQPETQLTPLMLAADKGDVDCLVALIDCGADLNYSRADTRSPLVLSVLEACPDDVRSLLFPKPVLNRTRLSMGSLVMTANRTWKEQHEECALLLLQAGASVDFVDQRGYTLLMLAAASGSIKVVKAILQVGGRVNQVTADGMTALMLACKCCSVLDFRNYRECVHALLQAGAEVNGVDSEGKTAAILAVQNSIPLKKKFQRTDILQLLIQYRADVNIRDREDKTALMYAAQSDETRFCELLLNNSADVCLQDKYARTALMYVTNSRCLFILLSPLDPTSSTSLHPLDAQSRHRILAKLLNLQDQDGKTALMHAVHTNSAACCDILLGCCCCDANLQDRKGRTALMYARRGDCVRTIIFRSRGRTSCLSKPAADLNLRDKKGRTALMSAAAHDLRDCCEELLAASADVEVQDNLGMTALMHASGLDSLWPLLSYGASLETEDYAGNSVLVHALLAKRSPAYCTFLLQFGANPLLQDHQRHLLHLISSSTLTNEYAIDNLIKEGCRDVIRLLVCNGYTAPRTIPSASHPDHEKPGHVFTSCLADALRAGHLDVAKYFIATGYLSQLDLRDMVSLSSCLSPLPLVSLSRFGQTEEYQLLVQAATSQPWPLVKLAFIAVSSALGVSPTREQRVSESGLPPRLQRMLTFKEPVCRLPVSEWSRIPLCFDPTDYLRTPRQTPLLYYWPFGRDLVV